MPRAKTEKRDQQVYKLDDGASVTIDFIIGKRPKFFQPADGVVIIGDHECAPVQMVLHEPAYSVAGPAPTRGGNFDVDFDPKQHPAFKKFGQPAPPDYSPPVETTEQLFAAAGMQLDTGALNTSALEAMDANHPLAPVDDSDA